MYEYIYIYICVYIYIYIFIYIYRVCPTMKTNIILRCTSNHEPSIGNPICRKGSSSMSMRRIRSRQSHTSHDPSHYTS